jgi:biopolymer transport protein TolQ
MSPPAAAPQVELDPLSLAKNSSGIVFVVLVMLIVAAVVVWFITVLKLLQLRRWANAQARFEEDAAGADGAEVLFEIARHHADAPGARVVHALAKRRNVPAALEGVAKRALVEEQKRSSSLMPLLASIGSAGPFVGLFGTVWGIMDAFLRIGREKSASLPVVAPAIGEALIATAVGLFAAIPAVVAYNAISKRVDDLLGAVEAAATGWVGMIAPEVAAQAAPPVAPVGSLPPQWGLDEQTIAQQPRAPQGQQPSWPPGARGTPAPAQASHGQRHAAMSIEPPTPRVQHQDHADSMPVPLDRPRRGGPPPFPGAR